MHLLLDTHAYIWFINGDKSLPSKAKSAISHIENKCFISIASIWEIAIKSSLDRLSLKSDFSKIADHLSENDIEILPIAFEQIEQLLKLPYHHKDPFDRIIIAQGMTEHLTILTKDESFTPYDVKTLWA